MKRILVVDDEPLIREVIGDVLREEGYGVLFASGGKSMLRLLESERPDLVLLDVMMPDGDGNEAFESMQAKADLRDIPVVVVSTGVGRQRLGDHSVPFLIKPIDLDHLLQVISDAIGPGTPNEP